MNINDIEKKYQIVKGDFNDLSRFNFEGVYVIYEECGEVVYVGSAYARNIEKRLGQYKKTNDTGNSLMHAICKKEYDDIKKVKDISTEQKQAAVDKIKKIKILAIPHRDLEYQLIHDCNPKYNTAGALIDSTED